jgi:hypothetical protein
MAPVGDVTQTNATNTVACDPSFREPSHHGRLRRPIQRDDEGKS